MEGFNYIFEDSTWGFDADAGACAFDASACVSDAGACIMNNTGVLESTENMKRTEILKEHSNSIWYSEKEGYWYCCLPDSTKKSGWKNVKRKKKSDIENLLCDHYINLEKQSQENADKRNMTLESLFYEFMEYKKKLVKAGTIKRMVADWERFYKPHPELIQKPFKELTKIDIDMFFNNIVNEHSLKDKAFHNMCGVLKQTLKYAIMISLAFAIVVTTICEIDGTILTRIFTNNQDVIKNGALYLKTYSIDCLLTSFLFCINGYLDGYERTVFTMVHSLVAAFVGRIPLTLLFSKIPNVTLFHMGIATPLSTMISLVMIFIYFKKTKFDKIEE